MHFQFDLFSYETIIDRLLDIKVHNVQSDMKIASNVIWKIRIYRVWIAIIQNKMPNQRYTYAPDKFWKIVYAFSSMLSK